MATKTQKAAITNRESVRLAVPCLHSVLFVFFVAVPPGVGAERKACGENLCGVDYGMAIQLFRS
jgi:hypothetical protein